MSEFLRLLWQNRTRQDAVASSITSFQFRSLVTFVALFAIELDTDPALPALGRRHPRTLLPRRLMAHVLRVSALKLGHPVGVLILMEADDFLFHRWRARRGLFR
jgi:hypothetical protein